MDADTNVDTNAKPFGDLNDPNFVKSLEKA
jgi:hypothetical protein